MSEPSERWINMGVPKKAEPTKTDIVERLQRHGECGESFRVRNAAAREIKCLRQQLALAERHCRQIVVDPFVVDAIAEVVDERDDLRRQLAEANELINHWSVKAKCYGDIVFGCTPALESAGFTVDRSGSDGSVGGIRRAVEAMAEQLAAANERVAKLIRGYREAVDDIESWGSFATDYFQKKHDLEGCLELHRAILAETGEGEGDGR